MTYQDFLLIATSFSLKMLGASVAICILGICAIIGAKVCGIDIKKAVDLVEKNPTAFAILVTGHFIGAALVISSAW